MMEIGERQVALTRDGIYTNHVERYKWAAKRLAGDLGGCFKNKKQRKVIDLACGVGYGTQLLAEAGFTATGLEIDPEAIEYARAHYAHKNAKYRQFNADVKSPKIENCDAAVSFETIEHLKNPLPMLRALRRSATLLLASVPNEDVLPFVGQYKFHHRHYTPGQLRSLLLEAGWHVTEWWGQEGIDPEVKSGCLGQTIIAVAVHAGEGQRRARSESKKMDDDSLEGKHVAIVGMGPSAQEYISVCRGFGGRHAYADETWVINAFGDVLGCDRVFHMDDVRVQQIRAAARPESNIARMLEWMRQHPGPIITSRAHPDYPGLVEFPLEAVLNDCPFGYFNSTSAYAVAYAVHKRAAKISLFGVDFTYPSMHDAEKGRACVEFWLGMAVRTPFKGADWDTNRGMRIVIPKTSSLMDACNSQADRFYGYDTLDLRITREDGRIKVLATEREQLLTAEEYEERYNHDAHPNPLMTESKQ